MAQFSFSLNAMIDGTQQTVLSRFNVDDSVIPSFFEYYRAAQIPPIGTPPPQTDAQVYKAWARAVMGVVQGDSRGYAERKAAANAVAGMPPQSPITET
jgi:hypothetical protein